MQSSADRQPPAFWRRLAALLCLVYVAALALFYLLRLVLPRWPPALVLIAYFGPFLFLPLLLMVPLAVASRSRAALLGTLAAVALFAILYGGYFVPRLGSEPESVGRPMVVMTYNIGPHLARLPQVVRDIADAGADLVAVQELTPASAQALRDGLSAGYAHVILDASAGDIGLLSRYPILSTERFRPAGTGRRALQAVLDVDGATTQVIVLHPEPPNLCWQRSWPLPTGVRQDRVDRELADAATRASRLPGPVIVLGDLNAGDLTRGYASMAAVLADAYREAGSGFGFTFPFGLTLGGVSVPGPLVRIDYVFHSAHLYARWARVGCGASDHCYVLAELVPVAPPVR